MRWRGHRIHRARLLAGDHAVIREGLDGILASCAGVEVVAEGPTTRGPCRYHCFRKNGRFISEYAGTEPGEEHRGRIPEPFGSPGTGEGRA